MAVAERNADVSLREVVRTSHGFLLWFIHMNERRGSAPQARIAPGRRVGRCRVAATLIKVNAGRRLVTV